MQWGYDSSVAWGEVRITFPTSFSQYFVALGVPVNIGRNDNDRTFHSPNNTGVTIGGQNGGSTWIAIGI